MPIFPPFVLYINLRVCNTPELSSPNPFSFQDFFPPFPPAFSGISDAAKFLAGATAFERCFHEFFPTFFLFPVFYIDTTSDQEHLRSYFLAPSRWNLKFCLLHLAK